MKRISVLATPVLGVLLLALSASVVSVHYTPPTGAVAATAVSSAQASDTGWS
jgi:hypothetical protein